MLVAMGSDGASARTLNHCFRRWGGRWFFDQSIAGSRSFIPTSLGTGGERSSDLPDHTCDTGFVP
jgi:hypothetical protein